MADEPVSLPARDIPPPSTISDLARASLSAGAAGPAPDWPPASDLAAWREAVAGSERLWAEVAAQRLVGCKSTIETEVVTGVICYVATPPDAGQGPLYLYMHGGGFVFGGGDYARMWAGLNADRLGVVTVSVDYRMPPGHPFPAGLEDCFAVYKAVVEAHDPRRIVIGGSSAGGNMAAAVALMIRDRGLPQPAGVVLLTPEIDLAESGDTFQTNALLDVTLKGSLREPSLLYAGGHDLTDPYLSPLHADLTGFPPALIQAGTRDLFLSNAALMHRKLRKAGVQAELHVWEAMPHGGFGAYGMCEAPENAEIDDEVGRFIRRVTA